MLNKIADRMAEELLKRTDREGREKEIYVYGIELILSNVLIVTSILALSALMGDFIMGVIFLVIFAPLRLFTGGYHAATYGRCYVITILSYCVTVLLQYLLQTVLSVRCLVFILFLMAEYISLRAPVTHVNQPLSRRRKMLNARIASVVVLADLLFIQALSHYSLKRMGNAVFAMGLVTAFMLFADIKKEKGGTDFGDYCEDH